MTLRLIAITVISATLVSVAAGGKQSVTIEAWLQKRRTQLAAVEDHAKIRVVELDQSEKKNKDGQYRMYLEKGFLKFSDGSWVLLTSHSAHAEDGLADISLIRTSTGEFYSNRGHCCLPILLFSEKKVESLKGFLETHGKGGEGKLTRWEKLDSEQDGARQPATAPKSKSEGKEKTKPDSEGRSQ